MEKGYNPYFLSEQDATNEPIVVPMPLLSESLVGKALKQDDLKDAIYLDYLHYSLVMNKTTKQLIFAASNVNQSQYKRTTRGGWNDDTRIPFEAQLNNDHYYDNPYDKGHMVRREISAWGATSSEAQKADNATMFYTNAAFQHENINRDEWQGLENMFRDFDESINNRLNVFTGTVHNKLDRYYTRSTHDRVRIPSGFFKVICFINKEKQLETRAFVMYQDSEMLKDRKGRSRIGFNYRSHQVTITELEHLTGLDFDGKLYDTNPLFFNENETATNELNVVSYPERILVETEKEIINSSSQVRGGRLLSESEQNVRIIAALVSPLVDERNNEWVCLMNITLEEVDLSGWKLRDGKQRAHELSGKLAPGESQKFYPKGKVPLTNTGSSLTLINVEKNIVDSQVYTKKQVAKGRVLVFGD